MTRATNITGNFIPYSSKNGQVYLGDEKLNDVIIREFGKESTSISLSLSLAEVKPKLEMNTPSKINPPQSHDFSSAYPELLKEANESEEN